MSRLDMLIRGILRRCPNCGERHIFRRWLTMVDRCPRCGLYFEREEGHWTGAMAINIVVTELVFAVLLFVVIIRTWPDIPSTQLLIAGALLNVTFPLFFYPISKTIWVAFDLIVHPLEPREQHEMYSLRNAKDREHLGKE